MIPFLTSTYLRLGLAVGLVAAVALMGWRVSAWHSAYEALPKVEAALEAEVACEVPSKCAERVAALEARHNAVSEQVVVAYENELEALRARPVERRVIRVCRAANPGDVRDAGTSGAAHGAGPAAGDVHGAVEFDPGAIFELAREADELAARLRALQQWNQALATPAAER